MFKPIATLKVGDIVLIARAEDEDFPFTYLGKRGVIIEISEESDFPFSVMFNYNRLEKKLFCRKELVLLKEGED